MSNTEGLKFADNMPPLSARSRNLVRFARHLSHESLHESFAGNFSFRNAGSRFSILKSPHTTPGPDECFSLWRRDDRALFDKLLGLKVYYEGLDQEQQDRLSDYNAMNYYRSHISETFCRNGFEPMPPTEGECVMWYAAADVLCIRYRITNKSAVEVPVQLALFSEGNAGQDFSATAQDNGFYFENKNEIMKNAYTSCAEFLAQDEDISFEVDGTRITSKPVRRTIPAHGVLECRFAVRFRFHEESFPAWPSNLWSDDTLQQEIDATEEMYQRLPATTKASERHTDIVLKAAGTIRSLRYLDYDTNGDPCLTVHVSKSGTAATWFWDTGAALPGLGVLGERDAVAGAIRLLCNGIAADGQPPLTYEGKSYVYSYQFPLLTWGFGHFLSYCYDESLLSEVYEPLSRYVTHWLDNYVCDNNLIVYPPGATSLDDALRWKTGSPLEPTSGHAWYDQEWGKAKQEQFVSPDINAFLYLELRTLAQFARALGKSEEAAAWEKRAESLAQAINSWLIEPETKTYQDRHVASGTFTGLINMGSFLPVYAGIAPSEPAEVLCRDYLLSPEHFLTEMPFPVVDRAHPTFRSGGFLVQPPKNPQALVQQSYWRGRTWIHADPWLLGALWRSGFEEEADAVADKILSAAGKNEGIHECYDSITGFGNGHPEFLWSSAGVLAIADRFYSYSPVAQLSG